MKGSACLGAAAAVTAALLSPPAWAQSTTDAHHAASQRVLLADWVTRVEDELGRQLARGRYGDGSADSGVLRIKFNCSEDGRADKVTVVRSSGSLDLDRAATRAVKRIAVMHPLATGIKPDQVYYADIVFATEDDDDYRALMARTRDAATRSNAWYTPPADGVVASR